MKKCVRYSGPASHPPEKKEIIWRLKWCDGRGSQCMCIHAQNSFLSFLLLLHIAGKLKRRHWKARTSINGRIIKWDILPVHFQIHFRSLSYGISFCLRNCSMSCWLPISILFLFSGLLRKIKLFEEEEKIWGKFETHSNNLWPLNSYFLHNVRQK